MGSNKVTASGKIMKAIVMQVNGREIKQMERVYMFGVQETDMKETGMNFSNME